MGIPDGLKRRPVGDPLGQPADPHLIMMSGHVAKFHV